MKQQGWILNFKVGDEYKSMTIFSIIGTDFHKRCFDIWNYMFKNAPMPEELWSSITDDLASIKKSEVEKIFFKPLIDLIYQTNYVGDEYVEIEFLRLYC